MQCPSLSRHVLLLPALAQVVFGAACAPAEAGGPSPVAAIAEEGDGLRLGPTLRAAVDAAQERIDRQPGAPEARVALADLLLANGHVDAARREYERALAAGSSDPHCAYRLAHACELSGKLDGAAAAWARAAALAPDHAPIHWRIGLAALEAGRIDAAEQAFHAAIETAPDDPSGSVGLARVALARGDAAAALRRLEPLARRLPHDGRVAALLGRAYRESGELERARDVLAAAGEATVLWRQPWIDELDALRVGDRARVDRAERLARLGNLDEALTNLAPLLTSHPPDLPAVTLASACLAGQGRYRAALDTLEQARRDGLEHYRLDAAAAYVHTLRGEPEDALRALEAVAEVNPDWEPLRRMRAAALSAGERSR